MIVSRRCVLLISLHSITRRPQFLVRLGVLQAIESKLPVTFRQACVSSTSEPWRRKNSAEAVGSSYSVARLNKKFQLSSRRSL